MKKKKVPVKLKLLPIVIAAVSVVIIMLVILLIEILKQNYIVYENIAITKELEDKNIQDANIIIENDIILGGESGGKWVSAEKIYRNIKGNIKIDMYSETGKYGTYDTASFKYNKESNIAYTTTTKVQTPKKYIAFTASDKSRTPSLVKVDSIDADMQNVKTALGKYKFLNNSVKVINAYDVFVEKNTPGRLIVATSDSNLFGVYSAVIYVGSNGPQLVKYAYVKNSEKSISWPVYTANFVIDIDGDGTAEVILQETTETTTAYAVMKYENGIFKEVLKQTIKL